MVVSFIMENFIVLSPYLVYILYICLIHMLGYPSSIYTVHMPYAICFVILRSIVKLIDLQ